MKHRKFAGILAAGGVVGLPSGGSAQRAPSGPRKNTRMHVGGDYHSVVGGRDADMTSRANLEYNRRHGVKHLTAKVRKMSSDGAWDFDEMRRMKDNCDRHGVVFEAIRMDDEYIRLRKGPKRDRRLESIVGNIMDSQVP